MTRRRTGAMLVACAMVLVSGPPDLTHAKIICWKDKSGKVVGCGDTVPPEHQGSATKELDKRGVTRRTTASDQDLARQRLQAEEAAKLKADEQRRLVEQRRQDAALLATYANEQEIEGKRDRDLHAIDLQVTQLRASLENAANRHKDAKSRLEVADSSKEGRLEALKDELSRAAGDMKKLEETIAVKESEKDDIRARYADYRKRYAELKGGAPRK